jgi:hypothetical protein
LIAADTINIIGDNSMRLAVAAPMSNRRLTHRIPPNDGTI